MEFLAALKKVYETRNSDEGLNEPFLIYSRTADLIGNSYEDKKKLSLFFAVSKRLNVLMLLSSLQLDGVNAIREQYSAVADLLSESVFNRLIDALIDIVGIVTPEMDEDFYEPYDNGLDDDYLGSGAIVYDGLYNISDGEGCENIRDDTTKTDESQTDFTEKRNENANSDDIKFDYLYKSKSATIARRSIFGIGLLIGLALTVYFYLLKS
mgnify:FL=1